MKKLFERIGLWLLLSAIFTTFTMPVYAAEENQNITADADEVISEVIINPLYKNVLDEAAITRELEERASRNASIATYSAEKTCSTVEEAKEYLRAQMVDRAESVTIILSGEDASNADVYKIMSEIFYGAMEYSNSCSGQEGDALLGGYSGARYSSNWGSDSGIKFTYTISYYTTRQQEEELTAAVNSALDEMQLSGLSEYDKVKKIHDYICDHVDYDYDNLGNNEYMLKQSAYAALINGKAVCQGYAILFYRMCKDAGLSVRYIVGTGNGGLHAWNIVRIGSVYYNVDCTWDGQQQITLDKWLLKSEEDFVNHTRDPEYDTVIFHQEFPMSATSWSGETTDTFTITLSDSTVELSEGSSYTVTAKLNGEEKSGSFFAWYSSDEGVAKVDGNGKITGVSAGSCSVICKLNEQTDAQVSVTVKAAARVSKITLEPTSLKLINGETYGLKATVTPNNAANQSLEWKSSNNNIATVDNNGKVTAVGTGSATITAAARDGSGVSGSCQVVVAPKLRFGSNKLSESIKSSFAPGVYLDNTLQTDLSLFNWSSSNAKVATVDSKGIINCIAAGTSTITCTLKEDKDVFATMQLTVIAKKVEQIWLSETSLQMEKGNSVNLYTTITPNESDWTVKWNSSNTKVATVDNNGKVTAVDAGTATITVTAQDGSGVSASCTVSVKATQTNQSGGRPNESSQETAASTTMFRLYNPNSGEHFYTGSAVERDQLVEVGWNYEGTAWKAPATSNTPVYRLYNPNAGDHHYTTSVEEKDNLVAVGWKYEGVGWYSDDALGIPLYRLYNPNAVSGSHHYTASEEERDNLVKVGWEFEGIAWYGMK